jgi:hypothetical protein
VLKKEKGIKRFLPGRNRRDLVDNSGIFPVIYLRCAVLLEEERGDQQKNEFFFFLRVGPKSVQNYIYDEF